MRTCSVKFFEPILTVGLSCAAATRTPILDSTPPATTRESNERRCRPRASNSPFNRPMKPTPPCPHHGPPPPQQFFRPPPTPPPSPFPSDARARRALLRFDLQSIRHYQPP